MAAAEPRVGAGRGQQPHQVAPSPGGHEHAGGGRDGLLQQLAVGPQVDQHRGAPLPGRVVVAHHEVAGAGGRRPVHPPEVVADDVGPQGVELLAGPARPAGAGRPAVGVVAGACRRGQHLVDVGQHGDLDQRRPPPGQAGEAEGVERGDVEGTDLQDAAGAGGQVVGRPDLLTGVEGGQQDLGAGGAAHRVAHDHGGRAPGAVVGDRELDPAVAADGDPVGPDPALDAEGGTVDQGPDQARHHQALEDGAEDVEVGDAEQAAGDDQRDPSGDDQPAGAGHRPVGIGTAPRISCSTSPTVVPRSRASGVRISRWPSTGSARALMSSGRT